MQARQTLYLSSLYVRCTCVCMCTHMYLIQRPEKNLGYHTSHTICLAAAVAAASASSASSVVFVLVSLMTWNLTSRPGWPMSTSDLPFLSLEVLGLAVWVTAF